VEVFDGREGGGGGEREEIDIQYVGGFHVLSTSPKEEGKVRTCGLGLTWNAAFYKKLKSNLERQQWRKKGGQGREERGQEEVVSWCNQKSEVGFFENLDGKGRER